DGHFSAVLHRALVAVEGAEGLSRLPPLLRGKHQYRRSRYVSGHVGSGEPVEVAGEHLVVVRQEGLLQQSIKMITCHVGHRARLPSNPPFCWALRTVRIPPASVTIHT